MKKCSKCKQVKEFSEFHKSSRSKDGHQTFCRPCFLEYGKEWREENKEKRRITERARYAKNPQKRRDDQKRYRERNRHKAHIWRDQRRKTTLRSYGLTHEDYEKLLSDQGSKCAICSSDDPRHSSGKFQVDHDHDTGLVRGLLCSNCNGGLGLFRDDPEYLAISINYLLGKSLIDMSKIMKTLRNIKAEGQ